MGTPQCIVSDGPAVSVVVFRAGEHDCAIPIDSVESVVGVVAIDPVPGAPRAVLGIINFHGTIVPVVDPRRRFGERGGELELDQKLILVHTPARLVALLADSIDGVEAISGELIVSMEDLVPGATHLRGSAAHKDGLIFVHDAALLLTRSEEKTLNAALRRRPQ